MAAIPAIAVPHPDTVEQQMLTVDSAAKMDLVELLPTTIIVEPHGRLLLNVANLVMEASTENVQQAKLATQMLILVQKFLHQHQNMEAATTVGPHGMLPTLNAINHATEAPTQNAHQTKNAGQMPVLAQLWLCLHQQYQCRSVVLTLIHKCLVMLMPLLAKNKINSLATTFKIWVSPEAEDLGISG
mmetsp:Transcript_18040/g.28299  ORF Transcript_18040/g.28299 Transcript_18040/m.28299 type:complete len:186 (-) Transcript_18040:249-806(-)